MWFEPILKGAPFVPALFRGSLNVNAQAHHFSKRHMNSQLTLHFLRPQVYITQLVTAGKKMFRTNTLLTGLPPFSALSVQVQ